ncbi:YicC family protein [soil metagenome]
MTLSSMTGYARVQGNADGYTWQWEAKSVNGKGLDIRCRVPPGFESLEEPAKAIARGHLKRGNLQIALIASGAAQGETLTVNETILSQLISLSETLSRRLGSPPPRAEYLLAMRGVLDPVSSPADEVVLAVRDAAMLASLEDAMISLVAMREQEGTRLVDILSAQLSRIEALTIAARDAPARSVNAIRARLAEQVSRLMDTSATFDRDRLHQEAVLLATRSDIQEEIDRLFSHIEAARRLIVSSEPAGRQLDFLAQEFNREANTLCSKAPDTAVTMIGLELKSTIDQMREQVQNIE